VSLGWALRHVDQLAGVVLSNTGVHQPEESSAPTVIRAARTPGVLPAVTRNTRNFIRGGLFFSKPVPPAEMRKGYYAPYNKAIGGGHRAVRPGHPAGTGPPQCSHPDAIADGLGALTDVPVLLLWGPRDPVFSDIYLRDLISRMPHADVHRYEGSSHFLPEDAPTFAADVATWVQDLHVDRPVREVPVARPLWDGVAQRRGDPAPAVIETGHEPPHNLVRGPAQPHREHRRRTCCQRGGRR
jgi:pimeloyl-ACP methyl ester carboxylesterase